MEAYGERSEGGKESMSAEQKVEIMSAALRQIRRTTWDPKQDFQPWCGTQGCQRHVAAWAIIHAEATKALRETGEKA